MFVVNQFVEKGYMRLLCKLSPIYEWSFFVNDVIHDIFYPKDKNAFIYRIQIKAHVTEFKYEIRCTVKTFKGSFRTNGTEFGFLSCNDNQHTGCIKWNSQHDTQQQDTWAIAPRNDLTVHMGDNIYADNIFKDYFDDVIDIKHVRERLSQLYEYTYTDVSQGNYMRHGQHLFIQDDHDFVDGAGIKRYGYKFEMYFEMACEIHRLYAPYVPSYEHNGFHFLLINTRHNLITTGEKLPEKYIKSCMDNLKTNAGCKMYFLCFPQPIVHLSGLCSTLLSYFHSHGSDEMTYPKWRMRTVLFLNLVVELQIPVTIFSGDVHAHYKQTHRVKSQTITELVTSGISRRIPTLRSKYLIMSMMQKLDTWFCKFHGVVNRTQVRETPSIGLYRSGITYIRSL